MSGVFGKGGLRFLAGVNPRNKNPGTLAREVFGFATGLQNE